MYSFIWDISIAPLRASATQRHSRHSTDTVPEFHAEAPQATVSKELAQDPYVAARAGGKPNTLRPKGIDSTKVPLNPTLSCVVLTASVVFELVPINKLNKFRFKSLL